MGHDLAAAIPMVMMLDDFSIGAEDNVAHPLDHPFLIPALWHKHKIPAQESRVTVPAPPRIGDFEFGPFNMSVKKVFQDGFHRIDPAHVMERVDKTNLRRGHFFQKPDRTSVQPLEIGNIIL